jgi:uncharacterized protein (DUF952 family)
MAEIFKVLRVSEWLEFQRSGTFDGTSADRRDGFIHFSAAHQLSETLKKHYASERRIVLLSFDSGRMAGQLRWEVSRNGERFPHLYDNLYLSDVSAVEEVPLVNEHATQGDRSTQAMQQALPGPMCA